MSERSLAPFSQPLVTLRQETTVYWGVHTDSDFYRLIKDANYFVPTDASTQKFPGGMITLHPEIVGPNDQQKAFLPLPETKIIEFAKLAKKYSNLASDVSKKEVELEIEDLLCPRPSSKHCIRVSLEEAEVCVNPDSTKKYPPDLLSEDSKYYVPLYSQKHPYLENRELLTLYPNRPTNEFIKSVFVKVPTNSAEPIFKLLARIESDTRKYGGSLSSMKKQVEIWHDVNTKLQGLVSHVQLDNLPSDLEPWEDRR